MNAVTGTGVLCRKNQIFLSKILLPGGQIEAYIQAVSQIPILTAEEEKEIADRLCVTTIWMYSLFGHVTAFRRAHRAQLFGLWSAAEADLIQEGNVGLMKAVKR